RIGNDGRMETLGLIGSVTGRHALIVDDEIDTAGTMAQAVRVVREQGARDVYVCSVHGILSGPAIERLRAAPIRELVLTDTAPLPEEKRLPNMTILSVAELFAGAITRIHEGRSVAELFR
ncbi:MAG TPA: ribose-phosphate diphosphokinase, partial [Ktedonobacterales bacterium]|nr:ribose-phosphate diphosphokinase [Ktedonobacterales bacterium]